MACACKANRDLEYLRREYGVKGGESKKTSLRGDGKYFLLSCLAGLLCIAAAPIFFIILIFSGKKIISIRKTMDYAIHPSKRKRNGKSVKDIQNRRQSGPRH